MALLKRDKKKSRESSNEDEEGHTIRRSIETNLGKLEEQEDLHNPADGNGEAPTDNPDFPFPNPEPETPEPEARDPDPDPPAPDPDLEALDMDLRHPHQQLVGTFNALLEAIYMSSNRKFFMARALQQMETTMAMARGNPDLQEPPSELRARRRSMLPESNRKRSNNVNKD